ncbi:MAG: N-acetyltransferase family protein [Vicinamibacteria bacterium]
MNRGRPAGIDDLPELASLMMEFYAEAGFTLARAAAERTFTALLAAPELGGVWLLESDGSSAGFVVLTVSFSMEYGGLRGFVDDFFVRSAFRRRGLGAAALAAVRRACQERGVRALLVEVGPSNDGALSVYRRAGFSDTGHTLLTLQLAGPVHAAGPVHVSEP